MNEFESLGFHGIYSFKLKVFNIALVVRYFH